MPEAALDDKEIARFILLFRERRHHRRACPQRKDVFRRCTAAHYADDCSYHLYSISYLVSSIWYKHSYPSKFLCRLFLCHVMANRCASAFASKISFWCAAIARSSPISRSGWCRSFLTTPTSAMPTPASLNTVRAAFNCALPPSTTNTRGSGHSECTRRRESASRSAATSLFFTDRILNLRYALFTG